jgi:hypothetical protein
MLTYFCPKCYAQNRADDEVCRSCGTRLDEEGGDYVDRLIRFSLHHPVPSIPPMAAETLGKIGDKRAVEPLMDVLGSSEEPGLLEAAAEALGRLGDKRAIRSLRDVLKRGTLAVRMKAVDALGKIGGDEAIRVLQNVAASDPNTRIRREAQRTLERMSSSIFRETLCEGRQTHKRGISITLTILDETLCEVEQWANGRELRSVFYRERNALSSRQKEDILAEIGRMRSLLQELQETLGLEPAVQDVGAAIRGKCAGLWEHIVELKSKYLARYGEVPAGLGDYLDPRADQLIQGITHILDALKRQAPKGKNARPEQKSEDR